MDDDIIYTRAQINRADFLRQLQGELISVDANGCIAPEEVARLEARLISVGLRLKRDQFGIVPQNIVRDGLLAVEEIPPARPWAR